MKDKYFLKQLFFIFNQIMIITYLCIMTVTGNFIKSSNKVHILLLSLLLWDAAYISYRNIKNNYTLKHFSYLLLLLGWQFLLSLFEEHLLSIEFSKLLLPICLYQSFYFIQAFIFQESAYQWQKQFLLLCKITCILSLIGFMISVRAFAAAYQFQFILLLATTFLIGIVHRHRVSFLLRSQKRELLCSLFFVVLPFIFYIVSFHNHAEYMTNMGSYFIVMLTFFSVHNIVFRYRSYQQFFILRKEFMIILIILSVAGLMLTAYLFEISLMEIFLLAHIFILLILLRNLFLYLQINGQRNNYENFTNSKHFYEYSLAQIKREETLKKDFSNYLHDTILQDLLSLKNLVTKSDQPAIKQLIFDTINELNASIRLQMQAYHPTLLKNLTLKENIQNLLDTLTENSSIIVIFDCSDTVFLVEPYNILIYRMIQELTTNTLKHSNATTLQILLVQEHDMIFLKVSDNGKGFEIPACFPSEHQGITSIQEQVHLLDGSMIMNSTPKTGTQISITIPMKGEDSYENFISR